ncbi:MAG: Holliday junction resolvase RuvX [Alphaproteobacteria bacterium]|nr:Holliday junction resolvase RuvX [Alphaproteobacteria bacterium]
MMNVRDLKQALTPRHSILGFDYGEKRLGLAVSDLLLMTADPRPMINRKSFEQDLMQIQKVSAEKEVGALVYGLPLQMDGTEGATAAVAREFAAKIAEHIQLPYLFWDERLSSKAVETFLIREVDMSRAKRKQILDSSAACYILQGVLDAVRYL